MNLALTNYDFIFLIIIGVSSILALIRGGVSELLSLCTWIIVYYIIGHYATTLDTFIPNMVSNHILRTSIVFISVFILVAIFIAIVKKLTLNMISSIGLGGLNYVLGFIFGIIRGIILCALLVVIVEIFNLDNSHGWKKSKLAPLINPVVHGIANIIPEQLKNIST